MQPLFFPLFVCPWCLFHLYSPISQPFVCVCVCVSGVYVRCTLYLDVVGTRSFSFPSLLFLSSCLAFPLLIFTRLTSIRYTRTLQPDRRTRLQFLGFVSFYLSTSCVSISGFYMQHPPPVLHSISIPHLGTRPLSHCLINFRHPQSPFPVCPYIPRSPIPIPHSVFSLQFPDSNFDRSFVLVSLLSHN